MNISQNGVNLIKRYEGLRLKAYKPVKTEKYWTIGYGHYGADVKEGMEITEKHAEELLRQDLKKFEGYVNSYVKVELTQNMYDSLVSFTYNCGAGSLKSSTLLKLLNKGDYKGAAGQFEKWTKGGGKVLPGLVKRRKEEKELFLSGGIPQAKPNTKTETKNKNEFVVGKTYTTTTNLYVRTEPNGSKKAFDLLTSNAKKYSYKDASNNAILRKDTKVTCQKVVKTNNSVWIKIPSGYICAINTDGSVYIK